LKKHDIPVTGSARNPNNTLPFFPLSCIWINTTKIFIKRNSAVSQRNRNSSIHQPQNPKMLNLTNICSISLFTNHIVHNYRSSSISRQASYEVIATLVIINKLVKFLFSFVIPFGETSISCVFSTSDFHPSIGLRQVNNEIPIAFALAGWIFINFGLR
jgi:hypothetical protein